MPNWGSTFSYESIKVDSTDPLIVSFDKVTILRDLVYKLEDLENDIPPNDDNGDEYMYSVGDTFPKALLQVQLGRLLFIGFDEKYNVPIWL